MRDRPMIRPSNRKGGLFETIKKLLRMIRPQGMISPLCASFAGMYLANGGFPHYTDVIIASILIIIVWFGGIILNDYFDHIVDAIKEPDRLIPSGIISRKDVLYASIILMSLAFLLSSLISIKLSMIITLIIILIVSYNSIFKKKGFMGSFNFGIIQGLSFMFGTFVIDTFNNAFIFITLSIISLHTSVNMIGAIKDIDVDIETGNWTVPARYGVDTTLKSVTILLLLSSIMAYIPGALGMLNLRYMPTIIVIDLWLIVATSIIKHDKKFGFMALGLYDMGAGIYYINFITGI